MNPLRVNLWSKIWISGYIRSHYIPLTFIKTTILYACYISLNLHQGLVQKAVRALKQAAVLGLFALLLLFAGGCCKVVEKRGANQNPLFSESTEHPPQSDFSRTPTPSPALTSKKWVGWKATYFWPKRNLRTLTLQFTVAKIPEKLGHPAVIPLPGSLMVSRQRGRLDVPKTSRRQASSHVRPAIFGMGNGSNKEDSEVQWLRYTEKSEVCFLSKTPQKKYKEHQWC